MLYWVSSDSTCTGFGQYTTQVTLVVCKRTAIKVKTKDARVGANPSQSDLSCGGASMVRLLDK